MEDIEVRCENHTLLVNLLLLCTALNILWLSRRLRFSSLRKIVLYTALRRRSFCDELCQLYDVIYIYIIYITSYSWQSLLQNERLCCSPKEKYTVVKNSRTTMIHVNFIPIHLILPLNIKIIDFYMINSNQFAVTTERNLPITKSIKYI